MRFSIGGVGQEVTGREGTRRQRQFQTVESTAWKTGSHTVRFGADYRRMVPIRRDATGVLSAIADDITTLTDNEISLAWQFPGHQRRHRGDGTLPLGAGHLAGLVAPDDHSRVALGTEPARRWPPPLLTFWIRKPALFSIATTACSGPCPTRNFAPRLGLAWRVRKSGRTVFRAGGGLFYDSSLSIATDLINNGPFNITYFTNSAYGFVSSLLSYGFSPNLQLPRLTQWNGTLDQALGEHDVLSIGYVGSEGHRLIRREVGGPGNTPTALFALTTNNGASAYHGLQVQYRRRVLQGLQSLVSYSWSHSLDNDSSDAFLMWAGPGAAAARDHGSSDFDLRHSLTAALTYELPARTAGRARWLGGWAIDSMVRARSGFPISVLLNEQYQGIALANAFRPDRILNQPIWLDDASVPGGKRFNPAAFQAAPSGTQGTLGRNSITGFGMGQVDLALRREFRFRDRGVLQVRLEAFNVLNEANFADPVKFLSSALFGQSTSMLNLMLGTGSPGSGLSPILQTGGPRSLQATVRFRF